MVVVGEISFILTFFRCFTLAMFSFIDPASSHAAALLHFHSYAMFFLTLVIIFVI